MSNFTGAQRKSLSVILTSVGLVGFFSAVVGEKRNSEVTRQVKEHGWTGFLDLTSEVLKDQTSGSRGRPALEEKPIHTMLKAIREVSKVEDADKATKLLAKALKVAAKEQEHLQARRAEFKPSKRIQGTRRLPGLIDAGENAKA